MNNPTPEQIEAAARVLYDEFTGLVTDAWEHEHEDEKGYWLGQASAALVAAADALEASLPSEEAMLQAVEAIADGTISVGMNYSTLARDDAENIVDAVAPILAAAGGVQAEPEWEYQWGEPGESFVGFDPYASEAEARADMDEDNDSPTHRVMRRRKAGPWEPVGGECNGDS